MDRVPRLAEAIGERLKDRRRGVDENGRIEWEEDAPTESDRYGGDLGRTLGFPVRAGPAHHPQRSVPC